jgi:hypothetical protein
LTGHRNTITKSGAFLFSSPSIASHGIVDVINDNELVTRRVALGDGSCREALEALIKIGTPQTLHVRAISQLTVTGAADAIRDVAMLSRTGLALLATIARSSKSHRKIKNSVPETIGKWN